MGAEEGRGSERDHRQRPPADSRFALRSHRDRTHEAILHLFVEGMSDNDDSSNSRKRSSSATHKTRSREKSKKVIDGSADDAGVFFVEKILKKRAVGNGFKYLVKWRGYGDEFNTWERGSNFASQKLIT